MSSAKGLIDRRKEDRELSKQLLRATEPRKYHSFETRMAIVEKLWQVKHDHLSPEDFYKQVSKLPMPGGWNCATY